MKLVANTRISLEFGWYMILLLCNRLICVGKERTSCSIAESYRFWQLRINKDSGDVETTMMTAVVVYPRDNSSFSSGSKILDV